ncbi:MAG: hypothetical protein GEU74_12345 [Nitriliruptorales bacterium]|nr:hypothetical protein [Nitriliruptorales bacterium]
MSARDDLAALFRAGPGEERLGDKTPGEIADAILAARWRPPTRTVSTVEELDALMEGEAVVITSGGVAWIKGDRSQWMRAQRFNEAMVRTPEWLARCGPLTVLWNGGA